MNYRALLKSIKSRDTDRGIITRDRWLRELTVCLGGKCPSGILEGVTPAQWRGWLKATGQQLAYTAPDMRCVDGAWVKAGGDGASLLELPPHTLAKFSAVVTSTRQDRDGDVLESKGGLPDPLAPLLWQHIPDLPIGRALKFNLPTDRLIDGDFTIANTALGQDAALLAEHGALRISHGFLPTRWEPLDARDPFLGYHILEFKILEVSLVSVPSNPDAVIEAFSREKLAHPLVKAWAGAKFHQRPASVPVGIDLRALPPGTTITIGGDKSEKHTCACGKDHDQKPYSFRHEADGRIAIVNRERDEVVAHADSMEEAHKIARDREMFNHMHGHGKAISEKEVVPGDPITGWHACRVEDPGKFEPDSFRVVENKDQENGKPVHIIIGKLKDGDGKTSTQAIRYPMSDWTESEASADCKKHDGAKFTAGKKEEEGKSLTTSSCRCGEQKAFYKGIYVDLPGSWERIIDELTAKLRPYLLFKQTIGEADWVSIAGMFDSYATVVVLEDALMPAGSYSLWDDANACYYDVPWGTVNGQPTWTGEPVEKTVDELLSGAAKEVYSMFTKGLLRKGHLADLKGAVDRMQKAHYHEDAKAGPKLHLKRGMAHVQKVIDDHDEDGGDDKGFVTADHLDRLEKAAGYCQKALDHADTTDPMAKHIKAAKAKIEGVRDSHEPEDEDEDEKQLRLVKEGRAVSAANEKKLKAAKSSLKEVADDEGAHQEVAKAAQDGVNSIDQIFTIGGGGDSGNDYDADGNYVGADVGAYTDGEPNKSVSLKALLAATAGELPENVKAALSKARMEMAKKALGHAQSIIDHQEAGDDHKGHAMVAKSKLKSVMGEGAGDDGPALGTDPSTAEPGRGEPEKTIGTRASDLADEMRFALAEGDEGKLFDIVESAGAVQSLADAVREAQLEIDLRLAESVTAE